MTDLDLEKLARRAAPAADASARAAALTAAMQAFDDAEKNADATQGSTEGGRQSSIFNRIWSPIMNRKLLAVSALATLLVVPAAAFLTLELTRTTTLPGDSGLSSACMRRASRSRPEDEGLATELMNFSEQCAPCR